MGVRKKSLKVTTRLLSVRRRYLASKTNSLTYLLYWLADIVADFCGLRLRIFDELPDEDPAQPVAGRQARARQAQGADHVPAIPDLNIQKVNYQDHSKQKHQTTFERYGKL